MKEKTDFYLICHNIRSLYNIGSVFRTADAAGVSKIFLCGITPAPDNRKAFEKIHKVALGAEKYISWEKKSRILPVIKNLKNQGFFIVSLEQGEKSVSVLNFKKNIKKIALVLGNEVKGIPKSILSFSDSIIEIPMLGRKESLNVGVAFGIAAYFLNSKFKKLR